MRAVETALDVPNLVWGTDAFWTSPSFWRSVSQVLLRSVQRVFGLRVSVRYDSQTFACFPGCVNRIETIRHER